MNVWRVLAGVSTFAVLAALAAILAAIYSGDTSVVPGFARLVLPGPLSASHAFLEEKCESCHVPHQGPGPETCIACHATNQALLARQPTAFHATIRDCSGCHIEHLGRGRRPTQMDHEVLMVVAKRSTKAALASGGLECTTCHESRDRHNGLFGKGCDSCHALALWTIADFQHPSPRSSDCAQCHQAPPSHFMGHFHMVSRTIAGQMHAQVDQCQLCHLTTAWNDIKGVGWYKHH